MPRWCSYSYALNDATENAKNIFVPSKTFFYNAWPKTMNGVSAINIALYLQGELLLQSLDVILIKIKV